MKKLIYKNANGRDYEVILMSASREIAILRPINPTFEQFPYMVARGFSLDRTSWCSGRYDMTLEQAERDFNS
jgi:hypothetical protein